MKGGRRALGVSLAALLLVAVGCAARKPPQIGERGPKLADPALEKAYQDVLVRVSDNAEIYGQLETRVFAAGTYQSWAFREARVRREAAFKVLPPAVVQERLEEERAAHAEAHEIFFGAFVNDHRNADFGRRDGIWRVVLVTDAGEVTPLTIERIGRSDLNMRAYYPYLGDFWEAWSLRFPKKMADGTPVLSEGQQRFILRVASTIGKVELTFPVE